MVIGQCTPIIGGAERQCLALSQALVARGHAVSMLTVWNPRSVPAVETIGGVRIERVWYPIVRVGRYRIGFGILAPVFFFAHLVVRARPYDVIHAHQALWPAAVAVLVARMVGRPVVCKIGNSGIRFDLAVLRHSHVAGRFAARAFRRWISAVVWTSSAVRDDCVREGFPPSVLVGIPNGVVLPEQLPRMPRRGQLHLVFVGTLTPKKNLLFLLQGMAAIPAPSRPLLTIVGDGPERAALETVRVDLGLSAMVTFAGAVADPLPLLRAADVFVLPSLTEGLSNAALEAMAVGLPLIVSRAGGNIDLIDGNGFFIDPKDAGSLARAILRLTDAPDACRRMGERSRAIVDERYGMENVVAAYEHLYARCLSAHVSR